MDRNTDRQMDKWITGKWLSLHRKATQKLTSPETEADGIFCPWTAHSNQQYPAWMGTSCTLPGVTLGSKAHVSTTTLNITCDKNHKWWLEMLTKWSTGLVIQADYPTPCMFVPSTILEIPEKTFLLKMCELQVTYLHDCGVKFITVGDFLCQHGLCKLTDQSQEVSHTVSWVGWRWHEWHVLLWVLVLVEQGCIQTLWTQQKQWSVCIYVEINHRNQYWVLCIILSQNKYNKVCIFNPLEYP